MGDSHLARDRRGNRRRRLPRRSLGGADRKRLAVTALIAGYAIFAVFGQILESGGAINTLNNGS